MKFPVKIPVVFSVGGCLTISLFYVTDVRLFSLSFFFIYSFYPHHVSYFPKLYLPGNVQWMPSIVTQLLGYQIIFLFLKALSCLGYA